MPLLVRDGGVKVVSGMEDMDPRPFSWFFGDEVLRFGFIGGRPAGPSLFWGSELNEARCWDKIDRFSSMGVKIL